MKKLMIAAAIVCAAAMSQAATISWETGDIFNGTVGDWTGDSKSGDYLEAGQGTLFVLGLGAGDSIAQAATDWAMLTSAETIWNAYDDSAKTLTINGHTYSAYNSQAFDDDENSGLIAFGEQTANKDDKVYAAVVLTAVDGDGTDVYAASAYSATVATAGATGAGKVGQFWYADGVQGAQSTWNAAVVPEPTSGLLLLLGVAGLALRRRRA